MQVCRVHQPTKGRVNVEADGIDCYWDIDEAGVNSKVTRTGRRKRRRCVECVIKRIDSWYEMIEENPMVLEKLDR